MRSARGRATAAQDVEPRYYTLDYRLRAPLIDEDFIDEYRGEVCWYEDEDDDPVPAGLFRASVVRVADALAGGDDPFMVCDGHSRELLDCCEAVLDPDTRDFRDEILAEFPPMGSDVLYLERIVLHPEHRGRGLGLAVASRLIDLLAGGCGLVACLPCPLQFLRDTGRTEGWAHISLDGLEADRGVAYRKLRSYWRKAGFRRIGRTGFYALSTAIRRPAIKELCPILF
jgi:GNAT superfamily N-acetyltransferase